jgi:hypothetical protein
MESCHMLAGLCNRRDELREAGSVEDDSTQVYDELTGG